MLYCSEYSSYSSHPLDLLRYYDIPVHSSLDISCKSIAALCQYGENPLRLAYWAAFLIVFFSFLYPISGVNATVYDPGASPAIQYKIITYTLDSTVKDTFLTAGRFLYYSVITFTTVGYGDCHPVGALSHFIAMIEAFLGIFMVGLFIWCLGKRVAAR